jgi:hypothetical protein
MNPQRVLLALSLFCTVIACARLGDRSIDSATTRNERDTSNVSPSHEQLVTACRGAAARNNPLVRWASDTALTADLNYDGAPELVVWGNEGDSLFVFSIVECSGNKSGHVWSMPLRAKAAFGTTNLDVALEDPAFGEGYFQENCLGAETTSECRHLRKIDKELEAAYSRGGRGLSVGVEDRDHVHIYWDPDSKGFVSWRP